MDIKMNKNISEAGTRAGEAQWSSCSSFEWEIEDGRKCELSWWRPEGDRAKAGHLSLARIRVSYDDTNAPNNNIHMSTTQSALMNKHSITSTEHENQNCLRLIGAPN